jgi:ribosomal protein L5
MGKAPDRKVAVDDAVNEIQKITGQKPVHHLLEEGRRQLQAA